MIRQEIKNLIREILKEFQKEEVLSGFDISKIKIEHPEEKTHGDYSANIALIISKLEKKDPMIIAESFLNKIKNKKIENLFEKIEVAKPGFINFFLSKKYLQEQVKEILKAGKNFGQLNIGKNKKIQVEFISANPTGPLTVGNARGGPFGDVLANVFEKAGFKTERAYYVNNYGMQILTLGHSVLKDEKAKYKGEYIDYLNKKIKEKDPYKAGQKAAEIIIKEMIKKTTEKMGIKFNEWFFENNLYDSGQIDKALETLKKKNFLYEKEEAIWFKSTNFGDNRDRVVIKKDGQKTYLAGDIAYHKYKFEKKKFDKVINIFGADHAGDVPGLQSAVEALGHKGKLDVILLQFVTLLEKGEKLKMSKRAGTYVTMDELLNKIPLDVIRFLFLQKSNDTHLNFDLNLAKEQSDKNPVYYVQYAYARICSILKKIKNLKLKIKNLELLNHPSELNLIQQLIKFPEIIEDTVKDYQVQRIPQYALDLAVAFHQFYRDCRVISEEKELTQSRLILALAVKNVLKNTLNLMGISAPEKM